METTTDEMIDEIVGAIIGPTISRKQAYYLRESLRHLIRLAKLEQSCDVKRCVALSVGAPAANDARQHKTAARKFLETFVSRQGRLNFESQVSE
jgi:hypothetical protein